VKDPVINRFFLKNQSLAMSQESLFKSNSSDCYVQAIYQSQTNLSSKQFNNTSDATNIYDYKNPTKLNNNRSISTQRRNVHASMPKISSSGKLKKPRYLNRLNNISDPNLMINVKYESGDPGKDHNRTQQATFQKDSTHNYGDTYLSNNTKI